MMTLFSPSPAFLASLSCLAFLILPVSTQAAAPDLTASGVIPTINRSETYNLGATGLRGWIYLSGGAGNTHGQDGTMTGESRQILVTVASAPANAVLAVDDVILGAVAASSGTVPAFSSDARKAFGAAIGDAEKTGAGTLRVKRWRAGTTTDVNIPMTIMGDYSATAPYSCAKSALILANARNKLVGQLLLADSYVLTNNWSGAISGLALLAGVQPGDPDYAAVQSRLHTYARARASAGPINQGLPLWDWAYTGLFLAEYYLATGDANVLPGINSYTLKLAQSQSIQGTFGHDPSVFRPDGSGRRVGIGYGPVNAVGIVANSAIVMGKKALLAGGQAVDPEINSAIQRGSDFFSFYVNKGPIPYGEHQPFIGGHSSNGKDAMCAVLFGLQAGRATETEYFSRMSIASYNGREYGHTGQGFSYLWGALGANMGGSLAAAEHLKPVRWHLDLSRRTDGSFAYDGAEQFGGGSTSDGSYLGVSSYYGLNTTASYVLTYSLPLKRLYITGKNDTPANPSPLALDSATVAHAVAAANIPLNVAGFTTAQLITSITDYDPVVRHYAATELGKRTLGSTDLTTLRNMLTGSDANGRMGASQALGHLQDTTSLPTLVQRLDKTTETDLWVRAKAASAIRSFTPDTASTYRDQMITAFIANATDPEVIVWNDPIQMSNACLSSAIFGDPISGGNSIANYTVTAAKSLLYPAVQTGLKQPDSYPRAGAAQFCYDHLPLADVQALFPDFLKVVEIECLADRMWSPFSRSSGIQTLSKYSISEGIPYAMAMLEIPTGFEFGGDYLRNGSLNALVTYGDAARWTLPKLRSYLGKWNPTSSEYTTLVSTIASIENAITAPALVPGLAVANSQVIATTGPKAITLSGSSPRSSFTFTNVTAPAHGTLTGTAPNLTYTPAAGYIGPDFFTFQVIDNLGASYPSAPGTVSVIVGTAGTGLKGEYFDNSDFTNLKLTRIDPQVNFDWATGSPNALLGSDTFSVRWDGLLLVPETGTYTFSTLNSDGVRLYVDGVLAIDDSTDHNTAWKDSASVHLTKGQWVDLNLRYYENTGSAVAKLKWTGPSFAGKNGSIIGSQWLFDGTGVTRTPYAHAQSFTMLRNTPLPITLTGSGGTLTYTILTPPAHGTLTGTAQNLTYTPATNYSGADSFTFLVNNGSGNSSPATISFGIWEGQPVDFYWAAAASGNWSGATSWTNSSNATVVPNPAGQAIYRMFFNQTGTYTATQDFNTGYILNQLNTSAAVTLNGTNSLIFSANGTVLPQFNQNSSSEVTLSLPVTLNATTQFGGSGNGTITLSGLISGTGGLTKNNIGMLRITNLTNTNSGGTIINTGTLLLDAVADAGLGTGPVTLNGGQLYLQRINAANAMIANGGEIYSDNGFGNSWNGPVTLNTNLIILGPSYARMTFNGSISGVGGLTLKGDAPVVLAVANTYSGPTSVTATTLECNHQNALGSGALSISNTANSKVMLNYTGTKIITSLALGGVAQAAGTYGSTASPATYKNDTYFSGTGTVTIQSPPPSAKLSSLQPSMGMLSPGFNETTFNYTTVIPYAATSMTIIPVASVPSTTIKVNGVTVASGSPSGAINVSSASSVINVVVTSSDTTVTNTYTVTVTHMPASTNANLSDLVPSAGTLNPTFANGTTSYTATVHHAVQSLTLTPTAAHFSATIKVNGTSVASGAASGSIPLNIGNNVITTVVTAENQSITKTYSLTVYRTANADLSSLVTSAGTLSPAFDPATFDYTATVPFETTSLTLTPTASDPAAPITVNAASVSSGSTSSPISLILGNNVISTVVVSQNGSTTNTYTLNVTRLPPDSRWWDGGTTNIAGNGNGASSGGAGTWDTTIQNWDQGNNLPYAPWSNEDNDIAVFAGTAGTVTLTGNATASGLRFDTANYILTGGNLTLSSLATITTNANATVSSAIAGSNGLTKAGTATLTLSGTNSFTGNVSINAGSLTLSTLNAWGGSGRNVTFGGTGALTSTADNYIGGTLAVGSGVTAALAGGAGTAAGAHLTFATTTGSGLISWSGGTANGNAKTLKLGNASGFTGSPALRGHNGGSIEFASLPDTAGSSLQFQTISNGDGGQSGTIAYNGTSALTFNNRQVQILARAGGSWDLRDNIIANNSANAAHTWTINTPISNTVNGPGRYFVLGGTNTGENAFNGVISNGSNTVGGLLLDKAGAGKWILGGANTHTGGTRISAGTLEVTSLANGGLASNIGQASSSPNGLRLNGGTLRYTGSAANIDRNFAIVAGITCTLDSSGSGALVFNQTDVVSPDYVTPGTVTHDGWNGLTVTDPSKLAVGMRFSSTAGVAGTITAISGNQVLLNANAGSTAGTVSFGYNTARTLTLSGSNADDNTIAGVLQNSSAAGAGVLSLSKTGLGKWVLSGANTYSGATTISAGTLVINGNSGSATANVAVNGTATLGGGGTIGGTVTVAASAKLDPGNSIGLMTINGGLNISAMAGGAGTIKYDLATPGASDRISVGGTVTIGSGTLGIENFVFTGALASGTYTLINGAAISGTLRTGFLTGPVGNGCTGTLQLNGPNLELVVSDTTAPTLAAADMVDNKAGGPIFLNTLVSYTITFNEDMNAATVTAADFGNTGSAAVTFGTIAEITPGVFTVQVTPTTTGTLQLRVNAGAVLADAAGNNLDTTSAIADDTTIAIIILFDDWAVASGLTAGIATMTANPDGDSLTNLQEYAFGTDPTSSVSGGVSYQPGGNVTSPGLPIALNVATGSEDYRAVFARRKNHTAVGLDYSVQFSADMINWVTSTETPTVLTAPNSTGDIEAVSVPYPLSVPVASGFRKPNFFRVGVSND